MYENSINFQKYNQCKKINVIYIWHLVYLIVIYILYIYIYFYVNLILNMFSIENMFHASFYSKLFTLKQNKKKVKDILLYKVSHFVCFK